MQACWISKNLVPKSLNLSLKNFTTQKYRKLKIPDPKVAELRPRMLWYRVPPGYDNDKKFPSKLRRTKNDKNPPNNSD